MVGSTASRIYDGQKSAYYQVYLKGWSSGNMVTRPLGTKEIDELLKPSGKAYTLQTGHLITGKPLVSKPVQENWFKSNHP